LVLEATGFVAATLALAGTTVFTWAIAPNDSTKAIVIKIPFFIVYI
jgi:hypothetical protein